MLEGCLRHDEVLIAEALIILGDWMITVIVWVIGHGLIIRVILPVVLFLLFGCIPDMVFVIFGVARSAILSGASIPVV